MVHLRLNIRFGGFRVCLASRNVSQAEGDEIEALVTAIHAKFDITNVIEVEEIPLTVTPATVAPAVETPAVEAEAPAE